MGKSVKALDYVFIARPVLFYPIWTVFFAGYIAAGKQMDVSFITYWNQLQLGFTSIYFWGSFLSLTFTMAAVFIINQFTDVHTDKENNKLFLLANGLVSKKIALGEILVFLFFAFTISLTVNIKLLFLMLLLFFITGVMYSLPPLFCKDRPYSGLLVNLAGGLLTFLTGWSILTAITADTFYKALPYIFAIGAVYFLSTIPDLKGDKNSGKVTFAVRFGPRVTIIFAIIFDLICVLTSVWQKDWVVLLPATLSLVFFFRLLWDRSLRCIFQATRVPILLLSIAVGIFFPFYFILMISVFLLSKWYYLTRFRLNYPSLSEIKEEV